MPAIEIIMTDGPLPDASARPPWRVAEAGAVLVFEGLIRGLEDGRPIAAIDYEHYEPMATRQMRALAERIATEHGVLAISAEHSRGRVAVGAVSFRLMVAAAHRQEALAAMTEFIDTMKRDVPIWKHPVFADPGPP